MDNSRYIHQLKKIYTLIHDYIANENDMVGINDIEDYIKKQNIGENKPELKLILHLISAISANHHRRENLSAKIQELLTLLGNPIKQTFSNSDIFYLFRKDKKLLLFLFQQKILIPDNYILHQIINNKSYCHFFYPEIKPMLTEEQLKLIENDMMSSDPNIFVNFEENRQQGENISIICSLIRDDRVEEFITYVNKYNYPLYNQIKPSIFETNSFLLKKWPTLIEYASFFGSIQIFQYLLMNNVELSPSLWLYAIHGCNAELIHLLEYNEVQKEHTFFKESIKCHHNDIVNYFYNNFLEQSERSKAFDLAIQFYNFEFIDEFIDFDNISFVSSLCKYDYFSLFESYLNTVTDINLSFLRIAAEKNNHDIVQLIVSKQGIQFNEGMFKGCKKLTTISIPLDTKSIQASVFEGCSSLIEISIPDSVELICHGAFEGCSTLEKVTFPSSVKEICFRAFFGCVSLKTVTIPQSVTLIGENAFNECTSLNQVTILSPLKVIQKGTFSNCHSLKEIEIPSSVNRIELEAFYCCKSLCSVKLNSSLEYIDENAFEECSSLTEISIPSSLAVIGDNAFYRCSNLKKIDFSIPSKLTTIGDCAFYGCSALEQITIPSSIIQIGESAMKGCSALKQITVPFDLYLNDSGIDIDVKIVRVDCKFI